MVSLIANQIIMGQAEPIPRRYTIAEYQALEERSEIRHQYYKGEVFAMAGGTLNHSSLILRCATQLMAATESRGCRVFAESVQLMVANGEYFTYPDVMVTCHPADVEAARVVQHPVLLIEVLSDSTAEHDRLWKLFRYQNLPSLRHYLLVSQQYQGIEWYRRTESGEWTQSVQVAPDGQIDLPELGCFLLVSAIYGSLKIPLVSDNKPRGIAS